MRENKLKLGTCRKYFFCLFDICSQTSAVNVALQPPSIVLLSISYSVFHCLVSNVHCVLLHFPEYE